MDSTDLKNILSGLALAMASLCFFAALILYAMGKINDTQGGRGEGMLIGLVCACIACLAAAAFIQTQDLNINIG